MLWLYEFLDTFELQKLKWWWFQVFRHENDDSKYQTLVHDLESEQDNEEADSIAESTSSEAAVIVEPGQY